ncbi:MAG: hypothetical protein ACJ8J0_04690 [Longimicrobiaceae bacterium]
MSRTTVLALLTTALAACGDEPAPTAPAAATPGAPAFALSGACVILPVNRTYSSDGFSQLNDFGRILADADNPNCAANAASVLTDKLVATRTANYYWFGDDWLDGNYVAMVLAAADRIGTYGYMTPELDAELQWVASTFKVLPEPLNGCGLDQTDNCLDGNSAAAAGYGWIAAYRWRHNDPNGATAARNSAKSYIDASFASVCLRRVSLGVGPLCQNGEVTPAMVRTGEAQTWSWNLGFQFPAYGFGLVTSIAAAVLGIEGSGEGYSMPQPDRDVAVGLFEETRRVVDTAPTPDIWPQCVAPQGSGSSWNFTTTTVDCGGPAPQYLPEMYALKQFYTDEVGYTPPTTGYQSSYFRASLFNTSPDPAARPEWFGYGRYVFYGELGSSWWSPRRPYMPMDSYEARGYLDRVDGARVAYGWACDPDVPTKAVRVELRVAGMLVTGLANQPSDGTISTQCSGGSAHRFSIQLPSAPVGSTVSARALDYTYGSTDLACSQAGACVVPAPPTVSVVWVQPAEASWGQPNTLTAAGHANGGTGGVKLEWRDVTFTSNPSWIAVSYEAPLDANASWSNTVPTPYDCHTIQVRATYFGVTTPVFTYYGKTAGFCTETARMIWIQPSSTAGFGPAGSLVVAGEAKNAPAGTLVSMYYRNVTLGQTTFTRKNYDAPTDANGIWLNDIPNANPSHVYEVYATYDVITTSRCTYAGTNSNTWC